MTEQSVGIPLLIAAIAISASYLFQSYTKEKEKKRKEERRKDMNIEFDGPGISLKRKHYPTEIEDDFRQKIIEQREEYNDDK